MEESFKLNPDRAESVRPTNSALMQLVEDLDKQIEVIKEEAFARGLKPEELRLPDGRWALTELLVTKAQVFNIMSQQRPQIININNTGEPRQSRPGRNW